MLEISHETLLAKTLQVSLDDILVNNSNVYIGPQRVILY